jgi:hypothetical protein
MSETVSGVDDCGGEHYDQRNAGKAAAMNYTISM